MQRCSSASYDSIAVKNHHLQVRNTLNNGALLTENWSLNSQRCCNVTSSYIVVRWVGNKQTSQITQIRATRTRTHRITEFTVTLNVVSQTNIINSNDITYPSQLLLETSITKLNTCNTKDKRITIIAFEYSQIFLRLL